MTDEGSLNVGNQGGSGTYNLSGGTLRLEGGALDVIGRNTGTHPASNGTIAISGTGVLDVQSAELILGDNTAAGAEGSGKIIQTGGTVEIEAGSQLFLSAYGNGEYDLNGGKLEVGGSNSLVENYNGHGRHRQLQSRWRHHQGDGLGAGDRCQRDADGGHHLDAQCRDTRRGLHRCGDRGGLSGYRRPRGCELCAPGDDGRGQARRRHAQYRQQHARRSATSRAPGRSRSRPGPWWKAATIWARRSPARSPATA